MTINDPIADMLTRVRNANSAGKATVSMPSSKKLVEIARIMTEEGYVQGYEIIENSPRDILEITMKYGEKKAKTIRGIKRISKPGLRIYAGKDELPRVLGGLGTAIVSTSKGVMADWTVSTAALPPIGSRSSSSRTSSRVRTPLLIMAL